MREISATPKPAAETAIAVFVTVSPVFGLGMDDACGTPRWSILVARLKGELGADPFTVADDVVFPVAVGDLVGLYERAVVDAAA